ncbi:MAG: hypothetical protein N2448_10100 [Caloramator sp.]|nr:hypothetical protein [Caloramator sp.]
MSFKETLAKKYAEAYMTKYGDRLAQVQGHVLSVKVSTKTILWIFHILKVDILIRPERSKFVVRTQYIKKQWFKKPEFMQLSQGNLVIIQGVKGKKGKENSETIQVLNIMNLTTKKDLIPIDRDKIKKIQQKQIIR